MHNKDEKSSMISHRVFAFCAPLLFLCSLGACKSKLVFSTNILCLPSFLDFQTLFLSIRGIEHNILYDGHAGIAQGGDPSIYQPQARYNAPLTKIIKNIIAPMPQCPDATIMIAPNRYYEHDQCNSPYS